MSFSRGRRPTLEYERPRSAVPTLHVVERASVPPLPPPKPAPKIAGGLRTKGIRRERPGSAAPPGTSPWGAPDLPDHPRPYSAKPTRRRPPSVGPADHSRGVTDEYRRLRFTLRNRAGPGVEGLERCLAAFAEYDPRRRGVIKRADFARALKNSMDVTLTDKQSLAVQEDCSVQAPPQSSGFARVDYCTFLKRCFPSESLELGVMSSEDRRAAAMSRLIANRKMNHTQPKSGFTSVNTSVIAEDDATDETSFNENYTKYAENSEPLDVSAIGMEHAAAAAATHHGTIAGVRNLNVSHESMYPTRVQGTRGSSGQRNNVRNDFKKQHSDVTVRTLDGGNVRVVPSENQREPPLSIFHGTGISKGNPSTLIDANVPKHEGAMNAVREQLRSKFSGHAFSVGSFSVDKLRHLLLAPFPSTPKRTKFDFSDFRRAMAALNVNAKTSHHKALFEYHCDTFGMLDVEHFCRQVVNDNDTLNFEGGAPKEDEEFIHSKENNSKEYFSYFSDNSTPSPVARGKQCTDITALAVNGTPLRSLLPERTRGEPLNIFKHESHTTRRSGKEILVGEDFESNAYATQLDNSAPVGKPSDGNFRKQSGPDSLEASGMRTLRVRLTQKLSHRDGDGVFFMKRWLTRETGDAFSALDAGEFSRAVEKMGLSVAEERNAVYERYANGAGYVDVMRFCQAVVGYNG